MKAVVYHADARFESGSKVKDEYQRLFAGFVPMCHSFGMKVVHLTTKDHPGWGDENHHYDLNPKNIVFNREEVFTDFLENAPDDVYWFAEPDFRINKMWPVLKADCAVLIRGDSVPMTPAWRLATPKALPFFRELRDEMRKQDRKSWHGDSVAFTNVWVRMGRPGKHRLFGFNNVWIETRDYLDYIKGRATYSRNLVGEKNKRDFLAAH